MEDIRQDNTTLRTWGNDESDKADELERELERTNGRLSEAEEEIEALKRGISEIENDNASGGLQETVN